MSSIPVNAAVQSAMPALPVLQTRPRLSIVLISVGSISYLDRALRMVLETPFYLETELVVVRTCSAEDEKAHLFRLSRQHGFSLELAPAGCNRDVLADLGSRRASGDILSVRDDHVVSDDLWLKPFASPVEEVSWDAGVPLSSSELVDRKVDDAPRPVAGAPQLADRVSLQTRQQSAPKRRAESATELNT